jgi:hypothetical protein
MSGQEKKKAKSGRAGLCSDPRERTVIAQKGSCLGVYSKFKSGEQWEVNEYSFNLTDPVEIPLTELCEEQKPPALRGLCGFWVQPYGVALVDSLQ